MLILSDRPTLSVANRIITVDSVMHARHAITSLNDTEMRIINKTVVDVRLRPGSMLLGLVLPTGETV